jgi:hypothetical protein
MACDFLLQRECASAASGQWAVRREEGARRIGDRAMFRSRVRVRSGHRACLFLALMVTWLGCSPALPVAPDLSSMTTVTSTPLASPPIAHVPGATAEQISDTDPSWYAVARQWVRPGTLTTVRGSRYSVTFLPGSLLRGVEATIHEYDPGIADFQLGPHGTRFLMPVTLTVSYAGTDLDPASPGYAGGAPSLVWLNPGSGLWELVPGVNNPLTKTYTVQLSHFSRYALRGGASGTGEW